MQKNVIMVLNSNEVEAAKQKYHNKSNSIYNYPLLYAIYDVMNNYIRNNNIIPITSKKNYRYNSIEVGNIYSEKFKVKTDDNDSFRISNINSPVYPVKNGYKRVTIARKKDIYTGKDVNDDIFKKAYITNMLMNNISLKKFIEESRAKIFNPIEEFIIDGNFITTYHHKMNSDQYYDSIKNAFNLINADDILISLCCNY